jgi:hypothetical protein
VISEVLTAVIMKSNVFFDVTCNLIRISYVSEEQIPSVFKVEE